MVEFVAAWILRLEERVGAPLCGDQLDAVNTSGSGSNYSVSPSSIIKGT